MNSSLLYVSRIVNSWKIIIYNLGKLKYIYSRSLEFSLVYISHLLFNLMRFVHITKELNFIKYLIILTIIALFINMIYIIKLLGHMETGNCSHSGGRVLSLWSTSCHQYRVHISSRLSCNSETKASELLENLARNISSALHA